MKPGFVAIIVAVLVIAGGAFVVLKKDTPKTNPTPSTSEQQNSTDTNQQNTTPAPTSPDSAGATITYSNSGFSPNKITVKSGTVVTIKNDSSENLQFDSDPHPVHTDNEELNVGTVAPGKSMTFTVTKKGTFGYHNHLDSSDTGTIVVE